MSESECESEIDRMEKTRSSMYEHWRDHVKERASSRRMGGGRTAVVVISWC